MSTNASQREKRQQERDFAETLIETAPVIILVLDLEGRIVRVNRYFEELSGYRQKELQGKDWFAILVPEAERTRMRARFLELRFKKHLQGANSILLRDGQLRTIE